MNKLDDHLISYILHLLKSKSFIKLISSCQRYYKLGIKLISVKRRESLVTVEYTSKLERRYYTILPNKCIEGVYTTIRYEFAVLEPLVDEIIKSIYINGELGETYTFYRNGELKQVCRNVNGMLERKEITYHNNGNIQYECNYSRGILEGREIIYYNNGNIYKISYYKQDKLHGVVNTYYNSSYQILYSTGIYIDGYKYGKHITYNTNGRIIEENNYNQDKLHGPQIRYSIYNGNIVSQKTYFEDKIVGTHITYYETGDKCREIKYKPDNSLEYEINYYKSGIISSKTNYTSIGNGFTQEFYSTGNLKREYYIVNSYIHGEYKRYRNKPHLSLEKIDNYINNYKEGDSYTFYANGSINMTIKYKHGNIISKCKSDSKDIKRKRKDND